jgi:hypothetical protein
VDWVKKNIGYCEDERVIFYLLFTNSSLLN